MTYTEYIDLVWDRAYGCKRQTDYRVILFWPSVCWQYSEFKLAYFGLN